MSVKRAIHADTSGAVLLVLATLCFAGRVEAQLPGTRVPGGCDVPVSQRTSEVGCYLTATQTIETLPDEAIFWHVYAYPTRAAAEAVQRGAASTVVESLGRVWLFTIAAKQWQPAAGERMAVIGPLPLPRPPATRYIARYMEAVFPPAQSLRTAVHRHSGPEAWFVLTGTQCLRTPESTTVIRAGQGGFVPAGPPMVLTSIGTETRRALVLVLHDPTEPWMTITSDWTPTNECPSQTQP
jgi:mannose-6-phosphate isomerase-like protein (cupin superfamily)